MILLTEVVMVTTRKEDEGVLMSVFPSVKQTPSKVKEKLGVKARTQADGKIIQPEY